MSRYVALTLLLLAGSTGLVSTPANAQSNAVLVSNLNDAGPFFTLDTRRAQGFDTGSFEDGYSIDSIELDLRDSSSTIRVRVLTVGDTGNPDDTVFTLTNPATISAGTNSFSAPDGARLDPDTDYFVVIDCPGGSDCAEVRATDLNSQTGLSGWNVANDSLYHFNNRWLSLTRVVRIRIRGNPAGAPKPTAAEVTAAEQSELVVTFNKALAAAANLANGAFVVEKTPRGGTEQRVSLSGSPSISGSELTLTLAADIIHSDTDVKVSYTKPTTGSNNKLADADGNETDSFDDYTVDNNTANRAPTASNGTVTTNEDTAYTFQASDFNFADEDTGETLASVKIVRLETAGDLELDGTDVTANQVVTRAQLVARQLRFTPAPNALGDGYASFGFRVSDGTAESSRSYTMTIDVTPVNDAPTASNETVTTDEDTAYTFQASDFNFADTDTGDTLANVRIVRLETAGDLELNGTDVTADQVVTKAQLDARQLRFTPALNANGDRYASFTFRVSDGTAESAASYTMRIDVTPVNDAPTGLPSISGTVREGRTLTASTSAIADADGLTRVSYSYQWVRVDSDGTSNPTDISGATSATYTLQEADEDKRIRVKVSFTDDDGTAETLTSDATGRVGTDFLVSNMGQTRFDVRTLAIHDRAQGFTTGSNRAGYVLESVDLDLDSAITNLTVKIATGLPSETTVLATLNNPTLGSGIRRFTAPANTFLQGNTTYYVVAEGTFGSIEVTLSTSDDSGGASGWSVENNSYTRNASSDGAWTSSSILNKIRVRGSARTTTENTPPTASDKTVTTAENTPYTFQASDFNFSDPDLGDTLSSVKIVRLETAGDLELNGTDVTANQVVMKAQLDAGQLQFTPAPNTNRDGYASFTFRVSDGTAESAASYTMTIDVTPVNSAPTGRPSILGTPTVGQTLTADTSAIADANGLTNVAYTYQWIRGNSDISGATSSTYTLTDADLNKRIKVRVNFTDDDGNAESLTSASVPVITIDDDVTVTITNGGVTWSLQGPNTVAPGSTQTYTLTRTAGTNNPSNIRAGLFSNSLELRRLQHLSTSPGCSASGLYFCLSVTNTSTGHRGTRNSTVFVSRRLNDVASHTITLTTAARAPASTQINVGMLIGTDALSPSLTVTVLANQAATGAPTISGTPRRGETLTASTSAIADDDGLTNVSYTYQWIRVDGNAESPISGATSSTYTLTADDVGKKVKVRVNFTDDDGNAESLTSEVTETIRPSDSVTITGGGATWTLVGPRSVQPGQTYTYTLTRTQGSLPTNEYFGLYSRTLGTARFKWGTSDCTGSNYFCFRFTNAQLTAQEFTVSGVNFSGGTLTSNSPHVLTLAVASGTPTGTTVSMGLTNSSGIPRSNALEISVTDAPENTPATGAPRVSGRTVVGETLTASAGTIADADGLDSVSYSWQWFRQDDDTGTGEAEISGETDSTYTLTDDDKGKYIKVKASFTDDAGNDEERVSAARGPVYSTPPTGATEVPSDWGLIPDGLNPGDGFRLVFISSTTRTASSSTIGDYDTHVQNAANGGHQDIQGYSAGFKVIGCTSGLSAREHTDTETTDESVPVYWLNGNQTTPNYNSLYDGSWGGTPRNEKGETFTNDNPGHIFTGCNNNGSAHSTNYLGATNARIGSLTLANRALSSVAQVSTTSDSFYGISEVFYVALPPVVPEIDPDDLCNFQM